jgi:predicted ABC-type ATPase
VDTDEAVSRAMKRAEKTGRMVPETTIRQIHGSVSDTFKKAVDHDLFDTAELWDNNGKAPRLIGEKKAGGSWTVHDQGAWQRFLDKGEGSHG